MLRNDETIEINEYSLIHIISRHFSEITKQYKTGKSYHNEDFKPRLLSNILQEIFNQIESSEYRIENLDKILFRYKDSVYLIWTSLKIKSIKGKGNIQYRRMETFYPITEKDILIKILNNYLKVNINNEISIYKHNII